MKSSILASILLVTPTLAATTSASSSKCLGDNVYRCLLVSTAIASPYCSSFLSIPVATVTVTTVTPTATTTSTTVSTATATSTSTTVVPTYTSPGFAKRAHASPVYVNGVGYHAGTEPALTARAVAPAAASPTPKCLTQSSSILYPAPRISSACSCLSVSTSTKYVTATAPTATSTVISASTTSTTLVTVVSTAPMATCPTIIEADGVPYTQYYKGSGFTETYNNPGNDASNAPPQTTTFPGTTAACDVLQQCASFAASSFQQYYSFDLHYLGSQGVYECTAFYDENRIPSYFNVANGDVISGVGYSL